MRLFLSIQDFLLRLEFSCKQSEISLIIFDFLFYFLLIFIFDSGIINAAAIIKEAFEKSPGILISKVIYIKETNSKNFIILDAGMNDFMRSALYGAIHKIIPSIKNNQSYKMYKCNFRYIDILISQGNINLAN